MAEQKSPLSAVADKLRPLLNSKPGPFVLLLLALILLSWIIQIVGYAVGGSGEPDPLVELLTGPIYTTVLVAFTVLVLWIAVDTIEKDKHARAQEYASAYEEVANAYKEAGSANEDLTKQVRSLVRSHALTRLYISIAERERELEKDFKVADAALRRGDLSNAQEALDRLDSNRKTVDQYLARYFPEHSIQRFTVSSEDREDHIDGEDECPSTSAKLKFKELKIVQPRWNERFRATMVRLETEVDQNKDHM